MFETICIVSFSILTACWKAPGSNAPPATASRSLSLSSAPPLLRHAGHASASYSMVKINPWPAPS
jgi:hypothetical protein